MAVLSIMLSAWLDRYMNDMVAECQYKGIWPVTHLKGGRPDKVEPWNGAPNFFSVIALQVDNCTNSHGALGSAGNPQRFSVDGVNQLGLHSTFLLLVVHVYACRMCQLSEMDHVQHSIRFSTTWEVHRGFIAYDNSPQQQHFSDINSWLQQRSVPLYAIPAAELQNSSGCHRGTPIAS